VAASRDDNNRYLRLSLFGDEIRLVYTVVFGEVPGRAERRAIDRDRDGALSSAETERFTERLAIEIAGQLAVSLDGLPTPVRFRERSFGGSAAPGAGAFSVDLVATVCARDAGEHALTLRDRVALPRPGETEVQLERGPGVTVTAASVGAVAPSEHGFRFAGPTPQLREPGLRVAFRVAKDALSPRGADCADAPGGRTRRRREQLLGALVAGVALVAVAIGLARRRRRAAKPQPRIDPSGPA
jgi:hypothetical protein